jgi:hypothetical protein
MDLAENFFSAFKLAINEEQKAYEQYMMLAEMCEESELKNLFEKFAADELQHKNILMERYKEMKNICDIGCILLFKRSLSADRVMFPAINTCNILICNIAFN